MKGIAQDEDLSVISGWLKYTDQQNALYHHLSNQAFELLAVRTAEIEKLQTQTQWKIRIGKVRRILLDIVGPFPEKTPLNAKIVGVIKKEDYQVEKIIFESRPKFYVTACLFKPLDLSGKTPAILYCSGHSDIAFRNIPYQTAIINLVKKGFLVLAFDPVGQGERLQYYDPEIGRSKIGGPTLEHSYPGAQCLLIASSQAKHMIWDGIRAIDYLMSRDEVDPKRIGITGRSGGGTQSSYIAAFDQRIWAAAPECYITSLKRIFESIGPNDAEQNFYHGIANGIEHADLFAVRVPKPALLIATTRDFFSIQGVEETATEIEQAYTAFGKKDHFKQVDDDAGHSSTKKNREAMYAFFQKHLNLPGDSTDLDVEVLNSEELKITDTGQISTSIGGETVYSINYSESQNLIKNLSQSRKNLNIHLTNVANKAKKLAGYIVPEKTNSSVYLGRYQREGYFVEKYFIQGEGDYVIPLIIMSPNNREKNPCIIYLHPEGKAAQAKPGQEMEWFVNKGYVVVAPDLVGLGEMGPGKLKGDAYNFRVGKASYNIWFGALQIARSLVGIRTSDIIRVINYVRSRADITTENLGVVAREELCPVVLHAAAFNEGIKKIALIEPLISYRSLVMNEFYKPIFMLSSVPGALTTYDLPDLCATIAPRKLLMINVCNQNGIIELDKLAKEELEFVKTAYLSAEAAKNIEIRGWEAHQSRDEVFSTWLK
jgi:cephalosporin-C deacetylase-like acetyl esterase